VALPMQVLRLELQKETLVLSMLRRRAVPQRVKPVL